MYVLEAACQRLHQLRLLCRRAKEDARLVHPFLPTAGRALAAWLPLCPNDALPEDAAPIAGSKRWHLWNSANNEWRGRLD